MSPIVRALLAISMLGFVVGCAGRTANPVPVKQYGDNELSCQQIEEEMIAIDAKVRALVPEVDKKTPTNVALGVTGAIFLVPLFFMDFSGAEQAEIDAYRARFEFLQSLERRKNCYEEDNPKKDS